MIIEIGNFWIKNKTKKMLFLLTMDWTTPKPSPMKFLKKKLSCEEKFLLVLERFFQLFLQKKKKHFIILLQLLIVKIFKMLKLNHKKNNTNKIVVFFRVEICEKKLKKIFPTQKEIFRHTKAFLKKISSMTARASLSTNSIHSAMFLCCSLM